MIKTIFLSLLMVQTLIAACGKGCLKCADKSPTDNTKVCQLCDAPANYYMKNDLTCALTDLTNCSVLQQDNTCGFCSSNYFLDAATLKCIAVDSLKKVTNCTYYDSFSNCSQCGQNFLKSNNQCTAITAPIANCMTNSSQTECERCQPNYYLGEDKKSCKLLPTDCLGYSLAQCKSCKPGFIINYNKYQKYLYKWSNNDERDLFYTQLFAQKQNIRVLQQLDFCEATEALNCATFTTFDQCGLCISGYYLDQTSLKCTKFPEPIIPNCNIYAFDDIIRWKYKCISCKDNFYLKDKTTCTAVDQSDTNCTSYDTTANTSRCTQCVSNKLLTNGSCTTDRTIIINCSIHYPSVNKCFVCNESYTKNNDETACKKVTPNCLIPKSFTVDSTENILCDKCKDEYYLASDNTCSKGAKNCGQYSSETVCLNCLNQFYSTPSCDNKHPNITNCTIYSQSTTNRCLKCSPMQVPIYLNQKCKTYIDISNCQVHDLQNVNTIKCTTCKKGYTLAQDQLSCVQIPVSENCDYKNGSSCTQCKEGYYLAQNLTSNAYSCISIPANITSNCSVYDQVLGLNQKWSLLQSCGECQQGYIGLEVNSCILKTNIPYLTNNTIPTNCLHMNTAGQCLKCALNYFLQAGQCIQTCNDTITWVSGDQINLCVTGTTGYLLQDTEALMCKSTHYSILKQDGLGSNLNWWKTSISSTDSLVANIADKQQSINCVLPPNVAYYVNGVSTTANQITAQPVGKDRVVRKFIEANQVKNYITVNCGWQKKGNISQSASADLTKYLNCESSISTDFSSERLGGIPTFWSNLFNVHKCTNSSQAQVRIPILVAVINDTDNEFKEWKQYNFARDTYEPVPNDSTGTGIFCLDVASPTTIMNGLQTPTLNKIANFSGCGLGLLDLALFTNKAAFDSTGYDITQAQQVNRDGKEQLKCLACKPGYKSNPDYVSDNIYARKCTAITNCNQNATQNIFDACSQCDTGYTWSSNDSGEIDFSVCVKIPSILTNCIGYNNIGGANGDLGRCIVCDKGYQLTIDGLCEQITIPSCVGNYYSYYDNLGSDVRNYIYQNGYGCSNCGDNLILYNTSEQCVKLPSLLANTSRNYPSTAIVISDNQTRGDGNLIDKCDRYNIDNTCAQCLPGHTKSLNGKLCKQTPTTGGLAKCTSLENDGTTCHECQNIDGYGLVTGQGCILQKIDGCSIYNYNNPRASVQCLTCSETYYQENATSCKKGQVPFCRLYGDNPLICQDCMSGYWLLKSSNINYSSYCLPKDTSIGCASANFSIESDSTPGNGTYNYLAVSCKTCESPFAYVISTEDTDTKAKCLPISYSGTCQTIDNNFFLNDDGQPFKCTKCADTEYLSNNDLNYVCKTRTNQDEERINCQQFSLSSELCTSCKPLHYLNKNQTGCTPYPTGLYGCVEYDNLLKCTRCNSDHYLSGNGCLKVASPEPVVNCNEYSSDTQCKVCDSGYQLSGNLCEQQSTNLNCLTFEAKDSCKTCPDEYKLTATNGKNSCVKVTKPSNCDIVDVSTAKCTQCTKKYYVNTLGQCVLSEIPNCEVNNTDTTCKRCEPGYALSGNATKCLSGTDLAPNCYEGVIAATPICSLCKAGYKFKDGTCQKNSNATIENGCFDEDTSKKTCIFCISGWSMGTDGKCTNNNPTQDAPKQGTIQLISLLFALIFFQVI